MIKRLFSIFAVMLCMAACSKSGAAENKAADESTNNQEMSENIDSTSVKVEVETTLGNFTILLYGDTPAHRDNFVKLVNENYYDSTLFHRVINEFMVQAGDPKSKTASKGQHLGDGDPGYTIPAEIVYPKHFHKRGALAAARTGDNFNPERRSSGSQFYVVTGKKFNANELKNMQMQQTFYALADKHKDEIRKMQMSGDSAGLQKLQNQLIAQAEKDIADGKSPMTNEMVEIYSTVGGTPHLDGQYTVFGEVISGMDTIEKIEKAETDGNDRPNDDIRILSMKIIK